MIFKTSSIGKTYESYNDLFTFLDTNIAKQSKCLSRKVGAALVKNGMVVSTGFNRVPKNTKDCKTCIRHQAESGKCLDICKAIHAEEVCILNYLKNHTKDSLRKCTLFVTVLPCYNCAKLIAELKIKKVIVLHSYNSKLTKELFDEAKIKLVILDEK